MVVKKLIVNLLKQNDIKMEKIKDLEFRKFDSQLSNGFIASIEAFKTSYFVYTDYSIGSVIAAGPDRKKVKFNSIEEAKSWCNDDYKNKLKSLLNLN